jgi:hypothetical protein
VAWLITDSARVNLRHPVAWPACFRSNSVQLAPPPPVRTSVRAFSSCFCRTSALSRTCTATVFFMPRARDPNLHTTDTEACLDGVYCRNLHAVQHDVLPATLLLWSPFGSAISSRDHHVSSMNLGCLPEAAEGLWSVLPAGGAADDQHGAGVATLQPTTHSTGHTSHPDAITL